MKISVAVPVYNAENFIDATLEAILGQKLPPDEVFVIDDGSTDRTPDILSKYASAVTIERIENRGCGAARKAAVEKCRNQWIALCDADDLWCEDHLARAAEILEIFPNANILVSNFTSFSSDFGERPERFSTAPQGWLEKYAGSSKREFHEINEPFRAQLHFNPIYPSGLIFHASIYRAAGGINPVYSRWQAEDTELTRRMLANSEARVVIDEKVSWHYRRHTKNMSQIYWKNAHARAHILQHLLANGVVPVADRELAQRTIADSLGEAFDFSYWAGDYNDARELYRELPKAQRSVKRAIKKIISHIRT